MQCIAVNGDDDANYDFFGECAASAATKFVSVGGGDGFSIAVDTSGAVVGWGSAFYGELAENPEHEDRQMLHAAHVRVRVPATRMAVPEQCVQVACGLSHVVVVSQTGRGRIVF